jgi:hypothetical protein
MTLPQLHDFPRRRLLDEFSGLKKLIEEFATRVAAAASKAVP